MSQEGDNSAPVNFADHVFPIFRQHCLQCHNANDAEAGLAIDSYGALMEGSGSGDVVTSGDPSASRLYLVMTHDEEPAMPPDQDPIPAEQLDIIKRWIEGGLLENSGSKAKKRKGPSLSFSMSETGKPDELIMPESVWRMPVVTSHRAAAATAIAASPWAPLVAVAGQKQVSLYHTQSSDLLGVLPYPEGVPQVLRFNRDGGYLLVAGGTHSSKGTVSLYDIRTGQRVMSVGDELDVVFGADINDTMTRVALGGPQKMVRIFDTESGESVFELKKHTDWVYCVDYSPDGVLVASGDRAGGLHVWEAETGRLYLDLVGHKGAIRSLMWRADSNVLLSASEDGTVKMWEMNAGNQLKSFNAHSGGVTGIAMAQDGKIVTSGKDKTVKVWKADGTAIATMPAFSEPALEVAITHDSGHVIGGDWNGKTLMWQLSDPKIVAELSANPPSLNEQIKQQVEQIALLKNQQSEIAKRQKAGEDIISSYVESEKNIGEQISKAQTAMEVARASKTAAQEKLTTLKGQLAATQKKVNDLQGNIAQLDKTTNSINQNQSAVSKKIEDANSRLKMSQQADEKIKQEIAGNQAEEEKLKAGVAAETSKLSKQEMELRAKLQISKNQLDSLVKIKSERTGELQALQKAIVESKSLSEKYIADLREHGQKKVDAEATLKQLSDLIVQLEGVKQKSVVEKEAIQSNLKTESDEEKKSVLNSQLMGLEKTIAETEAKKEESIIAVKQLEEQLTSLAKSNKEIETSKGQQEKKLVALMKEQEISQTAVDSAMSGVQKAEAEHAIIVKRLEEFSQEMVKAEKNKDEVVTKIAKLISNRSTMQKQLDINSDSIKKESLQISDLGKQMSKMATEMEALKSEKLKITEAIKANQGSIAVMTVDFKKLPTEIEMLTKQFSEQQKLIPTMQGKLAEVVKRRSEASNSLQGVKKEFAATETNLGDASAKLADMKAELIKFENTAMTLQDEASLATQRLTEHKQELQPLEEGANALASAISEREQKLKAAAAEMDRIQKELKSLEEMQAKARISHEQALEKLKESQVTREALEAAEQNAKEKVEFFQSAYGA